MGDWSETSGISRLICEDLVCKFLRNLRPCWLCRGGDLWMPYVVTNLRPEQNERLLLVLSVWGSCKLSYSLEMKANFEKNLSYFGFDI